MGIESSPIGRAGVWDGSRVYSGQAAGGPQGHPDDLTPGNPRPNPRITVPDTQSSPFDPDAAAVPGSGLFGLSPNPIEAAIHILAVPFDATTSYRPGTRRGPAAVLDASHQIDLYDRLFGHPYRSGIVLHTDPRLKIWNREARKLAKPIIEKGGHLEPDDQASRQDLERIEELCEKVNHTVHDFSQRCIAEGRTPAVLGGDHSVPLGNIMACANANPGLGILHIDAHADLRVAFEGFRYSHASVMHNALEQCPGIERIVQIGLRDVGQREAQRIESDDRIQAVFDDEWAASRTSGLQQRIAGAIDSLPDKVYISFAIDGLDPTLCPSTGTPVPGGLLWQETMDLLTTLAKSGKRVVGFDLCEVNPGRKGPKKGQTWDAAVGARLLYRLCGASLASQEKG